MPTLIWIPSTCPTPSGTLTTTTTPTSPLCTRTTRAPRGWLAGLTASSCRTVPPLATSKSASSAPAHRTPSRTLTRAFYVQPSAATRIGLDTYSQSAVTFDSVDFSSCNGFTDASGNCLSYTACPSGQAEAFPPTLNDNHVCLTVSLFFICLTCSPVHCSDAMIVCAPLNPFFLLQSASS
jgi:hypothetical protein